MISKAEAALSIVNMLHDVAAATTDDQDHGPAIAILREFQKKPGVRTTEFWMASILSLAGMGMQFWPGHETVGAILALGASSLYALSRMVVKVAESRAPVIPLPTPTPITSTP